jgi:hypothetical protein
MRTLALTSCLLLAACGATPPAPAAKADTTDSAIEREAARHHELKDAIDARDGRAKAAAAGDAALEADKKHDEQLEQDTGG